VVLDPETFRNVTGNSNNAAVIQVKDFLNAKKENEQLRQQNSELQEELEGVKKGNQVTL